MIQTQNVHLQFANYFNDKEMLPYFYLLSKKLAEGSICLNLNQIDWEKLKEEENGLTNYRLLSMDELKKNEFVSDENLKKPLVLLNNRLYFQRYFQYETAVLTKILALVKKEISEKSQSDLFQIKTEVQE
ncbi:MAG: hypothetical protein PHC38_08330, partial [Weeksellaceae bacterium]|nr:hypothetical protein [Weeksellaceae bacterium]